MKYVRKIFGTPPLHFCTHLQYNINANYLAANQIRVFYPTPAPWKTPLLKQENTEGGYIEMDEISEDS